MSLEGVQGESLPLMVVAALAHKIVTQEGFLLRVLHGVGILPHGPRFGIIMGRCGIQIEQVLGRIFSNAQISHRTRSASSSRTHSLLDLAETYMQNNS